MTDLLVFGGLILLLLHLGLWLWVAVEIGRRSDLHAVAKILWLLLIVGFPLGGLILYALVDARGGVRFAIGRDRQARS